jgi:hypothetical protein
MSEELILVGAVLLGIFLIGWVSNTPLMITEPVLDIDTTFVPEGVTIINGTTIGVMK